MDVVPGEVVRKLAKGGLNDVVFLRRGEQQNHHAAALLVGSGLEVGQISGQQTYLVSPWVVSPSGQPLAFPGAAMSWKVVGPASAGLRRQLGFFGQPVISLSWEQFSGLLQTRSAIWVSLIYGVMVPGSFLQRVLAAQMLQSEWRTLHQYLFNASALLSTVKQIVSLSAFWSVLSELSDYSTESLISGDESAIACLVGEAIRKKQSLGQETNHLQKLYDGLFT